VKVGSAIAAGSISTSRTGTSGPATTRLPAGPMGTTRASGVLGSRHGGIWSCVHLRTVHDRGGPGLDVLEQLPEAPDQKRFPSLFQHPDEKLNNVCAFRTGVEYRVTDPLALRAGFSTIRLRHDGNVGAGTSDADRKYYTVGAGYKVGSWTIDVSASTSTRRTGTCRTSGSKAGAVGQNGTWEGDAWLAGWTSRTGSRRNARDATIGTGARCGAPVFLRRPDLSPCGGETITPRRAPFRSAPRGSARTP